MVFALNSMLMRNSMIIFRLICNSNAIKEDFINKIGFKIMVKDILLMEITLLGLSVMIILKEKDCSCIPLKVRGNGFMECSKRTNL